MPFWQTEQVLKAAYGENYMDRFENFEKSPFAAASIGQVHLAEVKNTNEKVAVKIQVLLKTNLYLLLLLEEY